MQRTLRVLGVLACLFISFTHGGGILNNIGEAKGETKTNSHQKRNSCADHALTAFTYDPAYCGNTDGSITATVTLIDNTITSINIGFYIDNGLSDLDVYEMGNVPTQDHFKWYNVINTHRIDIKLNMTTSSGLLLCEDSYQATVPTTDPMTLYLTPSDESCFGAHDGSIAITVAGGNGINDFSVNGVYGYTNLISNLSPGLYTIGARDSTGCIAPSYNDLQISAGPEVVLNKAYAVPVCYATAVHIELAGFGGEGPYVYSIQNVSSPPSYSATSTFDLPSGEYTAQIMDHNGCASIPSNISFHIPSLLNIYVSVHNPVCYGANGSITAFPSGGAGPYKFSIGGPLQNNSTFSNVPPGMYMLSMQDANNCSASLAFSINSTAAVAPPQIILEQNWRNKLVFSWNTSAVGGCSYDGQYILYYSNSSSINGTWRNVTSMADSSVVITNLTTNTIYYFRTQIIGKLFTTPVSTNISHYSTAAPLCGDLVCDGTLFNETCTSCFFDCGACSYPTCGGTPECTGNGECTNGVCKCRGTWSGPICDTQGTVPININGTDTSTNITIVPDAPGKASFNIALQSIQEINDYSIVVGFNISDQPVALVKTITATVTTFNYTITLPNRAKVLIYILLFSEQTIYPFAGINVTIPANSLKYSIEILNWPFRTTRNRLQLIMTTDGISTNDDVACQQQSQPGLIDESNSDGSKNLLWFKLNIDGYSLYGSFIENTIADGQIGKVSVTQTSVNDLVLTVPFFWEMTEIDPVFSVLINPTSTGGDCIKSGHRVSGKIIGGVVGGVVGAACLAGVGIYFLKKHKEKERMIKLRSVPS